MPSRHVDVIYIVNQTGTSLNILRQTLKNDLNPFLKVIVLLRMLLNNLVVLPDIIPLEFNDLVDECLGDTSSKIIVLSLFVKWNGYKILMNGHHEFLQVDLFNQFIHVLGQLQQTLDNQTGNLRLISTVLVLGQQTEKHDKDIGMITVLEHPQH